ncbi:39998_t:CDS:2, partial [Gigaspora margarita]
NPTTDLQSTQVGTSEKVKFLPNNLYIVSKQTNTFHNDLGTPNPDTDCSSGDTKVLEQSEHTDTDNSIKVQDSSKFNDDLIETSSYVTIEDKNEYKPRQLSYIKARLAKLKDSTNRNVFK